MDFQNFQSTADVLSNSGSFVQKIATRWRESFHSSFEASRVLLLVDGVRMNNLIFRAGHLQNVITVDESLLDNVGILVLLYLVVMHLVVRLHDIQKAKFLNEVQNKWTGARKYALYD
jgi:hemoglobin/transferrin/lactoferrin receptor protein